MGHDVLDIRGTERQGMFDDELWSLAQAGQRMLVTTDKGFSEHRDEPHYVRLYINYLRQKLEKDAANPKYILTERGVGYRFVDFRRQGKDKE